MSTPVTFNGSVYSVPSTGDTNWDAALSQYLIALSTGSLQKAGGTQVLTADLDLGPGFGLASAYFMSRSVSAAASGMFRLAYGESVSWRNSLGTLDLPLGVGAQDQLTFRGVDVTGNPMASYNTTAGTSLPNATTTVINFNAIDFDTHSAVTVGAAWKFTVPAGKGGKYLVSASVQMPAIATGTTSLTLYKNGSALRGLYNSATATTASAILVSQPVIVNLVAGDFIDIRAQQNSGATITTSTAGSPTMSNISIARLVA